MASHPPMYVVEARITSFNPSKPTQPTATKSRGKKAKAPPPPPDAWPHPSTFKANPSTLAQAGFFYPDRNDPNASGIVDEVECFTCGHTLGGWEEQDDPHYEHAKRVKQTKCTWALAVCSIQSERVGKDTWRFMSSDRLPTARALEKARRGTFGTYWPHDQAGSKHGITSKKVAEAGFVFTPTSTSPDMATCPYCQTAFADWEMDDVPLALHQKKRPDCPVFTGKVHDPNETMDGPDEVDFLTPVAQATASRKASTQKGSSRKTSSAVLNQSQRAAATVSRQPTAEPGTSAKGKRLTRAASTAKPNAIDEASEHEAESEVIPQAPPKPTKKSTRGKSSVAPNANPLAKSTRSKKVAVVPAAPQVKEEEEDEPLEASDFEAAPAPPPKVNGHGRSRTQPQGQIQRQALSRDPGRSQAEEDENVPGPSRGASGNRPQAIRKVSGGVVKGSRLLSVQGSENAVEVNGAKVSRKKLPPRPPSPEEDEEMEEPEAEPEPVAKPSKKTKTAKKTTKKAEPVVEEDFDASPPPAPEPRLKDKPKPGKKFSPPEVVIPPRRTEPTEKRPIPERSKEVNKVPFPTIATPEPEVEEEPKEEEVVPSTTKGKKGAKKPTKSKKAPTKATKKAKSPEPEPPSPEANEMEVDDAVESAPEHVTEPELEPDDGPTTEAEGPSGTEASEATEQSEAEEPGMMEVDRPNMPLVDSGAINKAAGPTLASVIAPAKATPNGIVPSLEKAKSPQRTPKTKALPNVPSQTTPKPTVQDKPDVRMASPELPPPPPPPPEVTFTLEERKMTLIEYVRKEMQEEYERLKADGERELQSFEQRAEEVRRQLEAL